MSLPDSANPWMTIALSTAPQLTSCDDPAFWEVALREIFQDAQALCTQGRRRCEFFAQLGACSHWQRPHQHRWLNDGGFAAPYGYGGTGFNIHAWPVFDWSSLFRWSTDTAEWICTEKVEGKRPLLLRVALPTRTRIHAQAAVHSVWTPGSPTTPKHKVLRLYGFRKNKRTWQCTATAGHDLPYEVTN
jgi:hypothetical protein